MHPCRAIRRFDHVGITVADLDTATAFFVGLGFEVEGRMFMEGEFVDTVIGIPNSRSEIVMLRPPDGGTGLELSSFIRPDHEPGSPNAMSTELGLRNVMFEVDDIQAVVDRLAADGYGLVGGIGQYEDIWRMAYVRGPEGSSWPWPSESTDRRVRPGYATSATAGTSASGSSSRQWVPRMITSRIQPSGIGINHWANRNITIAAVIGAVIASPATADSRPT